MAIAKQLSDANKDYFLLPHKVSNVKQDLRLPIILCFIMFDLVC